MKFYSQIKRLKKYTGILCRPGTLFTYTIVDDSNGLTFKQENCSDQISIPFENIDDIIDDGDNILIKIKDGNDYTCIQSAFVNKQYGKRKEIDFEFLWGTFDTSLSISVLFKDASMSIHQKFSTWHLDDTHDDHISLSFFKNEKNDFPDLKFKISSACSCYLIEDEFDHAVAIMGLEGQQFSSLMFVFNKTRDSAPIPITVDEYLKSIFNNEEDGE